jgi:hypothetical protein
VGTFTTIAVQDAAATPVTHTFVPVKVDGDTAYWSTNEGSSASANWNLAITARPPLPGQSDKMYRYKLIMSQPVTINETINGVSRVTVRDVERFNGEFLIPASSVLLDRKNIRKGVVGVLSDSNVIDIIENLKGLYS